MNQFKKTTKKREKQRSIYFQIGLIIAGGLTLVAFEWTTPILISELPGIVVQEEEEWDMPVIIPEVEIEKPKVKYIKAPKKSVIIKVVEKLIEPIPDPTPDPEPFFDPGEFEVKEMTPVSKTPFTIVENMPEFIGGDRARIKFLRDNLKYPRVDKAGNIEGTVYLNFLVNKKGEIKKVKVLRGVSPTLDAEAIRVVKAMPNWSPGKQRGKAVNVSYNFRIKFKLS